MNDPSSNPPDLQGSCHCGAVRLTLPAAPDTAIQCNCSLCRRVAGRWAYYPFGTVRIDGHPENTIDYVWGDKTLRTIRCKNCGCVTHWEPIDGKHGDRHGVNLNNFPVSLLGAVKMRQFDGADTWQYINGS
jgi:hypothetical protein